MNEEFEIIKLMTDYMYEKKKDLSELNQIMGLFEDYIDKYNIILLNCDICSEIRCLFDMIRVDILSGENYMIKGIEYLKNLQSNMNFNAVYNK